MNCFEIQSRTSELLDGMLIGNDKREAEEHLKNCETCTDRFKHYRVILSSIESSPRHSVPVPEKVTEAEQKLPASSKIQSVKRRWRLLPWYIRTTIEGTGIVFLVLLTISAGPRLRMLYERQIERSVSEFNQSFSDTSENPAADLPAMTKGKLGAPEAGSMEEEVEGGNAEDGGETSVDEPEENVADVHVGNSEIWRFNLKTDSPKEIRNRIVQVLTELKVPKDTPGLGGIEAPGGIQFDILVSGSVIPGLKRQLQKIAPKAPEGLSQTANIETFAWYRNKSRKPLPAGKTRVVIWLSQI